MQPEPLQVTRHVSPDGALIFRIEEYADGDFALGFEGFPWHTHGDLLGHRMQCSVREAIHRFLNELIENRSIIAVRSLESAISNVWITDEPDEPDRYAQPGEVTIYRYWDGSPYDPFSRA